jgi:hypothetical protein
MIYQSDRVFKVWDYTVGHAQLLLRSPATEESPYNIDIVFVGVERIDIPTRMNGLTMEEPEPLPGGALCDAYRIKTGDEEFVIIAAAFRIYKNQHDLMESSLEYFSRDQQEKSPGEILSHTGLYLRSPEVAS